MNFWEFADRNEDIIFFGIVFLLASIVGIVAIIANS